MPTLMNLLVYILFDLFGDKKALEKSMKDARVGWEEAKKLEKKLKGLEKDLKKVLLEVIDSVAKKVTLGSAIDSNDALKYTQAILNTANAISTLSYSKK